MKKLKLFLSLCMMCLSLAVLCIGILAASSATYNINGNISYNMTADLAKINTRVYRVAGKSTESALKTAVSTLSTMTYAQIERDTTTTYIEHQRLSTLNAISETSTEQQFSSEAISMTFGEIEKEDECYYTYYIVISIVNKSTDGTLTATLTDTIASDSTFYRYTNATQTEIANDEIKNIVIGISKIDNTEITEQKFTYTLTVNYVGDDWPTALPLKADTTNNYWYVELGTYNSSPVRWRLVSVNGTSAYTTFDTDNKPKYADLQGKALFLQETYCGDSVFETPNSTTTSSKIAGSKQEKNSLICESGNNVGDKRLFAGDRCGKSSSTGTGNNYWESQIRTSIMQGKLFGFSNVSDFSEYVAVWDVKTLSTWGMTYTKQDELKDYFRLTYNELDYGNVLYNSGLGIWSNCNSDYYWTASPGYNEECGLHVKIVDNSSGEINDSCIYEATESTKSYPIRAIFTLA